MKMMFERWNWSSQGWHNESSNCWLPLQYGPIYRYQYHWRPTKYIGLKKMESYPQSDLPPESDSFKFLMYHLSALFWCKHLEFSRMYKEKLVQSGQNAILRIPAAWAPGSPTTVGRSLAMAMSDTTCFAASKSPRLEKDGKTMIIWMEEIRWSPHLVCVKPCK